ncbi:MAG TPA: M1 family metallopeptidase [Chitinophagaceae bacterium]|nr:M1 family metallopeptidase [Chitinophagaceae bacterium]
MKKLASLAWLTLLLNISVAQDGGYWQQQVDYRIEVTLDDKTNSLDAFEQITYTNHSPDTLRFIWFHCWPNAYKNDRTAFSDQLLENGNTRFYFAKPEQRGYINRLDFRVDGHTARTEDHPQYIDIIKLILPEPLPPGGRIQISTPFHVKLPFNFSRGGYAGSSFQVTQWYPKPAVYDRTGWHPMPYLDQGEFYSEFGRFDVRITVPANYVVAATGELQDTAEKVWLAGRRTFHWTPVVRRVRLKGGGTKRIRQDYPTSAAQTKTLRFLQEGVHDFSWFADKRYIVDIDTCRLPSGRTVQVYSFYTPGQADLWKNSTRYAKEAIRFYSGQVGEYPFATVSVVQGPESFGGGMEYPTITVISPVSHARQLEQLIVHEVGHNWFYSLLATDERTHAWMDEGINSFFEQKYFGEKYQDTLQPESLLLQTKAVTRTDQPIELPSDRFSPSNYELVVYYKTAAWMHWLQSVTGEKGFQEGIRQYFTRWQFRHPGPADFRMVMERAAGRNLDSVFTWLDKPGLLPSGRPRGSATGLVFQPTHLDRLVRGAGSPYRELVTLSPLIGYNAYDRWMVGGLVTNYKLPPSAFQWLLAPLYATGSSGLAGLGKLSYTWYPSGAFRKATLLLNGSRFADDRFTDSAGHTTFLHFFKVVPGLRLTLRETDPRSTRYRFLQFKTYVLGEDNLQFGRDTLISGADTLVRNTYRTTRKQTVLNQFRLVWENNRALYPYQAELQLEQSRDFIRAAVTGHYFFNYADQGGLGLRLFAGKFMYLGGRTPAREFRTDRYHLNMTGANGSEDYTYSDYFLGRNQFDGLPSQQIMMRDGGFKIRTDLLSEKVGKTDDWLVSANFTSTLPGKLNPFGWLPGQGPLRLFADIGTYAGAWSKDAGTDHFLYDAGFQVSLLKETVNIYLPLFYSRVYRDYVKTVLPSRGRIWHTISFSMDLARFSLRKIDRNLSL